MSEVTIENKAGAKRQARHKVGTRLRRLYTAEDAPLWLRLAEAVCSFGAGLLLSFFRPAAMGAESLSLGLGAACAAWLTGRRIALIYAFSGTMLGTLICADWFGLCTAVFSAALCPLVSVLRRKSGEASAADICIKLCLVSGVQLALIPVFCTFIGDYSAIRLIARTGLTALSAWVLHGAGQAAKRRIKAPCAELSAAEYLLISASVLMPAAALGGARVLGVGLFSVFGGVLSLWGIAANGADALFITISLCIGNAVGAGISEAYSGLLLLSGALAAAPMKRLAAKRGFGVGHARRLAAGAYFVGYAAAGVPFVGLLGDAGFCGTAAMLLEAAVPAAVLLAMPDEIYLMSELGSEREKRRASAELKRQRRLTGRIAELAGRLASVEDGGAEFYKKQLSGVSQALLRANVSEEAKTGAVYRLSSGFATEMKRGSEANGDSSAVANAGGNVLLMLSDGMGSGAAARRESTLATELLKAFAEAGFRLDDALEGVNRILAAADGERGGSAEMYATMDVLCFDRSCGTARFAKFGAPPSYVIRNGRVYTLYAETLPAGIVGRAMPALRSVKLESGDTVVLMTDGLFDALGSALTATLLEKCCGENTEADAANAIMECCIGSGGAADDMSVIVARIV